MELNKLPKLKSSSKKRLGRGYGSGKGGHTAGRGAKGAKARGKIPLTFTGTKTRKSFLKKLPLQRGKGRFKPLSSGPMVVNLKYLNLFSKGEKVDLKALIKKGLITEKEALRFGVKILGDGDLTVSLEVAVPCSRPAAEKIAKAGGKVISAETKPAIKKAPGLKEESPSRVSKKVPKTAKGQK